MEKQSAPLESITALAFVAGALIGFIIGNRQVKQSNRINKPGNLGLTGLNIQLQKAVEEERYEDAAEIKKIIDQHVENSQVKNGQ